MEVTIIYTQIVIFFKVSIQSDGVHYGIFYEYAVFLFTPTPLSFSTFLSSLSY